VMPEFNSVQKQYFDHLHELYCSAVYTVALEFDLRFF
jgi:hypothetical protein